MPTYSIKQKIFTMKDSFKINDQYGKPVYEVVGKFFSWGDDLSVKDLNGVEVARIKQKRKSLYYFLLYQDFAYLVDGS
jgi:uncharacterized protein YxjI